MAQYTWKEIAKELGVTEKVASGQYYHHKKSFTDEDTYVTQGKKSVIRLFTESGRDKLIGFIRTREEQQKQTRPNKTQPKGIKIGPRTIIPKLREPVLLPPPEIKPKQQEPAIPEADKEQDEILDLAVKIVADRQRMKKLEERNAELIEENSRLQSKIDHFTKAIKEWL